MEEDLNNLKDKLSQYINIQPNIIDIHTIEDDEIIEIKKNEMMITKHIDIPVECYSFSCLDNYEKKYKHLEDKECIILSNINNLDFVNNSEYLKLKIDYDDNTKLFLREIDIIEEYMLKIEDYTKEIKNSVYIPDNILNKLWLNQGDKISISNVNLNDMNHIDTIILNTDNKFIDKYEISNIKDKYNNKLINSNDIYLEMEKYIFSIIDITPKKYKYLLFNKDITNIIFKDKSHSI